MIFFADNGNRVVYGTENGVYLADLREKNKVPVKVISAPSVTQLDVLEEQGILIVLAGTLVHPSCGCGLTSTDVTSTFTDKAVQTFFIDHLDPGDAIGAAKRARKISANATFFKAGQCLGRTLVCVVKSGNVSSTIKTLEPIDQARGKKQPTIRKFLQGSNESLRVFKVRPTDLPTVSRPSAWWCCAVADLDHASRLSADRNSTSRPSRRRSTFSNRSSASAAPRASRLSTSRRSTRKGCSTRPIRVSTLCRSARRPSRSPSTASTESSCCATMVGPAPIHPCPLAAVVTAS